MGYDMETIIGVIRWKPLVMGWPLHLVLYEVGLISITVDFSLSMPQERMLGWCDLEKLHVDYNNDCAKYYQEWTTRRNQGARLCWWSELPAKECSGNVGRHKFEEKLNKLSSWRRGVDDETELSDNVGRHTFEEKLHKLSSWRRGVDDETELSDNVGRHTFEEKLHKLSSWRRGVDDETELREAAQTQQLAKRSGRRDGIKVQDCVGGQNYKLRGSENVGTHTFEEKLNKLSSWRGGVDDETELRCRIVLVVGITS
ncbi:hypothetical protein J6590_007559 [Homalodisca vitripennis]|nr:hypothetical protein J6590_007559 [Homalodisca vitripennis]